MNPPTGNGGVIPGVDTLLDEHVENAPGDAYRGYMLEKI
jgi:hypothetical protein